MEHPADFDDAVGASSVEQKVPRAFDSAECGGDVIATVIQVMRARHSGVLWAVVAA